MNKEVIVFFYSIPVLEFPNSADKDALSPGTGRIPSHGRLISHYQGEKDVREVFININFFSTSCFSSNLNSK